MLRKAKKTRFYKLIEQQFNNKIDQILDENTNLLKEKGHSFIERNSIGRMDCILIKDDKTLEGGADKRGDNVALGY